MECFSVHCHVFAIIKETRFGRSATVCGGTGDTRKKHAYTSEGHAVEIRFMTGRKAGQYLLKYESWWYTIYVRYSDKLAVSIYAILVTLDDLQGSFQRFWFTAYKRCNNNLLIKLPTA